MSLRLRRTAIQSPPTFITGACDRATFIVPHAGLNPAGSLGLSPSPGMPAWRCRYSPAPASASVGFAVDPLARAIVAAGYAVNRPAITLGAFVALPVLQLIDCSVDAICFIGIDFAFMHFVVEAVLKSIGALPRTNELCQPIIIVVIVAIMARISTARAQIDRRI